MLVDIHSNAEVGRDTVGGPLGEFDSARGHTGELGTDTLGMSGLGNWWAIGL